MKFLRKKPKVTQLFITFSTLVATAAINYTIIHSPIILVFVFSLFVHEFGHYFISKYKGAKPDFPYFIPLFPLNIGITRIKNLKDEHKSQVALAGVLFSSIFLLTIINFNLFFNIFSTFSLLLMLFFEITFNYFGSDGQKYRKYKSFVM
jgi:hypothetical protein